MRAAHTLSFAIALTVQTAPGAWLHGSSRPWDGSVSLAETSSVRWVLPGRGQEMPSALGVTVERIGRQGSQSPVAVFRLSEVQPDTRPMVSQGEGSGFVILCPAGLNEGVVRLYLSVSAGGAVITGEVSGGGTHYFADTSFNASADPTARIYTFNYAAARSGQTLKIVVKLLSGKDAGAISLWALSMDAPDRRGSPSVRILAPRPGAVFQAPAKVMVEAEAAEPGVAIAKVVFYDASLAIRLGEAAQPPYRIVVDRPSAWSGSFCARAYDIHGKATDSEPVRYKVEDSSAPGGPAAVPLRSGFPSRGIPGTGWEGVSSMQELPNGDILAIWYAGKYELSPDSKIYASKYDARSRIWSPARPIISTPNVSIGNAVLLWRKGVLWCFYVKCFGNAWEFARLFYRKSRDLGNSWGDETTVPLPEFPYPTGTLVSTRPLVLRNGNILLPVNRESYDPDPGRQWYSLFLISTDDGKTWTETSPLYSLPGNIQPAVEQLSDGSLIAFCRVRGQKRFLWVSRSRDSGRTWDPLVQTDIPNPSARVALGRLPDGRLVMAFNDSNLKRTPLSLALSRDEGRTWNVKRAIESGGFAYTYPFLIVSRKGEIHVTYNDNYHAIKHVVVDEGWFGER